MADQIKRQRLYEGQNGVLDKFTIDFNPGLPPNLQDILVSSQVLSSGSRLAVVVETSNCTGIAGSFLVRQGMEDSGVPNYAFSPAQTLALVATGNASVGMSAALDFMGAFVVLDASGVTWPSAGRMVIWIIAKQ